MTTTLLWLFLLVPQAQETGIMDRQIQQEIKALHQFFQDWFNGTLPRTEESFVRFSSVMGSDFEIVSPQGQLVARSPLLERLEAAHGIYRDQPCRIWVENPRVRQVAADLWLATYEEWQDREGQTRGRLSSALFQARSTAPNGVIWRHVHETWLPEKP